MANDNTGTEPEERADCKLFEPFTLRGLTMRNRIWLPPMDTYSVYAQDGKPTPFHYQHYVSRAIGGFGMVIVESTAISPEGRISPCDVGLWNDDQIQAWRWIVDGVKATGARIGVQLNHAGRKGNTGSFSLGYIHENVPQDKGGWQTVAPSPIPYAKLDTPRELSVDEIHGVVAQFRDAAARAVAAGFDMVEIHAAHGYLLSEFLDPLTNTREDEYGGSLDNRMRIVVETVDAVRQVIPDYMPLVHHPACERAGQTGLAGAIRFGDPQGSADSGERGRFDHQAEAGGEDCAQRQGGSRGNRPRRTARPVLAVARRIQARRTRQSGAVRGPVSSRRLLLTRHTR